MNQAIRRALWVTLAAIVLLLAACGDNQDDDAPFAGQPSASDKSKPAQSLVNGLPDFTKLVKTVSPAVVNVSAMPPKADTPADSGDNDASAGAIGQWLKKFFGEQGDPSVPSGPDTGPHVSLGSGLIISRDGYILTNRHVVAGAGQILVKLNDRRQLVARLVGADADSDIALLKVDAADLPVASIGDPARLSVGAWVVAIGSPFGFETSVTAGIVSAKNRNLADNQYVPFLQTDVAINPGNSGGPLFNMAGEVVGLNSQIYSQTGGYQGVSFAIPIDVAMSAARQLRDHGHVVRGWLGVQIQDVNRQLAASFGLSRPVGALVTQVLDHSPAQKADLQVGDVILAVNDTPVDTATDLPPLVSRLAPGETIRLRLRRNGKDRHVKITVRALPKRFDPNTVATPDKPASPVSQGWTLAPLADEARASLGLRGQGVLIQAVSGGAAAAAGLQAGDILLVVDERNVASPQDVARALRHPQSTVALLVLRDGARRYIAMSPNGAREDGPSNND